MHGKDFRDSRAGFRRNRRPFTFEAAMFATPSALPLAFLGGPELIALSVVVLLLFGTRLPSVMRSLGVGITEFKKGLKGDGITEPNAVIQDKRRDGE
jgi:sec-independent protein translocase protein TatA